MKSTFVRAQKFSPSFLGFFTIAVVIMWMKTYIVQFTQFQLGIESFMQHLILFLNPLGSAVLFLGIAFCYKGKKRYFALIGLQFLMTGLLFANILYYRFFTDFITLPTLIQTQNFGDVSGSVPTLIKPLDFLLFIDLLIVIGLLVFKVVHINTNVIAKRKIAAIFGLGLGMTSLNLAFAEVDRPELLTRGFDRNYIVKYLGMYNYTIYDAVQSTKATAQRVLASSDDMTEVINYTKSNHAPPNPAFFGIGKEMNIIYIHLESVQTFLINYRLHGEEVMPFLNSLTREEHTLYFENFFHQTAQGKTADAEFMLANSLYGLPQGSAFTTKGLNTYHSAPAILGQEGYTSAVFHGNSGSFWNRDEIYKSFGYDFFFDSSSYELKEQDLTGYGLMDKPFFRQSVPFIETLPQPFYAKFITVTHHYPFTIDPKLASIDPHTTGNRTVDNYFQTARYADEALEQFFTSLKRSGLYDNSIIILYGDHYGISNNHNKAMEQVIGKEVTPFESAGLQRTPLFIRIPGIEGRIVDEYSGQIDLLPTLLHLLGIDTRKYVHFGTDLFSEEHDDLIPFRNGDFVSPKYTMADGKFYDSKTGELLEEEAQLEEAKKYREMVKQRLDFSDKVVNGDLLRFYTPFGFQPIDRDMYDYHRSEN
ncbi:LTA synthase family protein [Bacillus sp. B15-48]|uniref:LTA synthase family protein n=1 Tax=Bacillus sp. B15-48 TaxID=1548601 RepID=UPI00193EE041|nr:LTA synthase family protein [Bacillus sp. B15-48]MBM4763507.1 sulfatase-like hydrolase/transferase [Bacillus sp. B15-48]